MLTIILIVLVVLLLFGGGGFYVRGRRLPAGGRPRRGAVAAARPSLSQRGRGRIRTCDPGVMSPVL